MKQRGAKSAFKRELVLGSVWSAYNHLDEKHLGVREVSVVQTNSVAFKTPRGDSWLSLTDKSADYTSLGNGVFQVYDKDTLVLTYAKQLNSKE